MQVVEALDFRRGPYTQLLAKQGDAEDTRAVRQPWSEWSQLLALISLFIFLVVILSTAEIYAHDIAKSSDLVDAASFLFPHLTNSSWHKLVSPHSVESRPDIKSFAFDLGGSTCACTMQWDAAQYWQRVWYGMKYVTGHVFTVFFGVVLLQRWQWVVIYKIVNECVEELVMPLFSRWANINPIQDVEPRYDTLINDLVLAVVPFLGLGCHVVYVVGLLDPFPEQLCYNLQSVKLVCLSFLQYFILNSYIGVADIFGGHLYRISEIHIDIGKFVGTLCQILILYFIWQMRALPVKSYYKIVTIACVILIPFVIHSAKESPNEQIISVLSFALAGIVTSTYHKYYTNKSRYILALALPLYLSALILYVSFASVVSAPQNQFYYKRKWCGIGFGGKEESCSRIRY